MHLLSEMYCAEDLNMVGAGAKGVVALYKSLYKFTKCNCWIPYVYCHYLHIINITDKF